MRTIEVDAEEFVHLTARRAAVRRFVAYCKTPIPKTDLEFAQDDKIMKRLEDELREKWGVEA